MNAAAQGKRPGGQGNGVLAAIRRQFPDWRLWKSDEGRLWATRVGKDPKPPGWWAKTVDADTPAELGETIAEQEKRLNSG